MTCKVKAKFRGINFQVCFELVTLMCHNIPGNGRSSSNSDIFYTDNSGHVIDLVNDPLPDVKISEEDKKKNLELLEEAKKVSERFLTRRGRKSRSSLSESPTGRGR